MKNKVISNKTRPKTKLVWTLPRETAKDKILEKLAPAGEYFQTTIVAFCVMGNL